MLYYRGGSEVLLALLEPHICFFFLENYLCISIQVATNHIKLANFSWANLDLRNINSNGDVELSMFLMRLTYLPAYQCNYYWSLVGDR